MFICWTKYIYSYTRILRNKVYRILHTDNTDKVHIFLNMIYRHFTNRHTQKRTILFICLKTKKGSICGWADSVIDSSQVQDSRLGLCTLSTEFLTECQNDSMGFARSLRVMKAREGFLGWVWPKIFKWVIVASSMTFNINGSYNNPSAPSLYTVIRKGAMPCVCGMTF